MKLINLSDFYRSTGRDPESRDLLLNALQVAPDSAITNHAYGLYLVRSGKQEQALKYFETSIRPEDSNPRHLYVYAVALDSIVQTDGIHRYLSLLASVAANVPQVRAWINKYGASDNF